MRCLIAGLMLISVAVVSGCAAGGAARAGVSRFPQHAPRMVWPAPPDVARIAYVGEITSGASIGAAGGRKLLDALVGAPAPVTAFGTPMDVAARGDRIAVADPQHPDGPALHLLDASEKAFHVKHEIAGSKLAWPIALTWVDERVALADSKLGCVFLVDWSGSGVAVGRGVLARPSGVAYAAATRELYVADPALHQIVVFDASGALKRRIGTRGAGDGAFNFPVGLWLTPDDADSAQRLVVADSMNFRVQVLDAARGAPLLAFGSKGDAAGDFALPRDVACDSRGNIYVLDNQFENVQVFDGRGRLLMAFGQGGARPGEFSVPAGIGIDEQDRIWIADTRNRRVQVFQYLRVAGEEL